MRFRLGVGLVGLLAVLGCGAERGEPQFDAAFLAEEPARYSQGREEVIIRHFFRDRRDGFFVDVGAYHWQKLSTTLYLEEALGWSGIAIDANRGFGPGYEENRPRTRFLSFLVTDADAPEATLYIQPASPATASASRAWVERITQIFNPGVDADVLELHVPAITLDSLLEAEGVRGMDFLSMDIEGHELAALAGFDLARHRPGLVCIEVALENQAAVSGYFERHDYRALAEYEAYDTVNRYFAPRPTQGGPAARSANPAGR